MASAPLAPSSQARGMVPNSHGCTTTSRAPSVGRAQTGGHIWPSSSKLGLAGVLSLVPGAEGGLRPEAGQCRGQVDVDDPVATVKPGGALDCDLHRLAPFVPAYPRAGATRAALVATASWPAPLSLPTVVGPPAGAGGLEPGRVGISSAARAAT